MLDQMTPEERARLLGRGLEAAPPGLIAALLYHVPKPDGDHQWPTAEEDEAGSTQVQACKDGLPL